MKSQSHIVLNSNKVFEYSCDYQIWIQPNKQRIFCAIGHFGHVRTIIFKNYNPSSFCSR